MSTLELIGKYEGERFRFGNPGSDVVTIGSISLEPQSKQLAKKYGVGDPDCWLTVKGSGEDLMPSTTYRFLGTFTNYYNKYQQQNEKQFHFRTYVEHVPQDPEGLVKYLVDNGRGNGIGPAKAKKIVGYFGATDVLTVCRTEPEKIVAVAQIDIEHAKRFAEKLKLKQLTENARIEVDSLLKGHRFPRNLSEKLIKEYGNEAANMVKENPYLLMQFPRVGFKLADALYVSLGKDPAAIERQALYLWYAMASDQSGHSWFCAADAVSKLRAHVGPEADYRSAIQRGRELGQLSPETCGAIATCRTDGVDGCLRADGTTLWLAEGKVAAQEQWLAELLAGANTE